MSGQVIGAVGVAFTLIVAALQVSPGADAIQGNAERLTLISGLCFAVVAFVFEWVIPGRTANKRIEAAQAEAATRIKSVEEASDRRVATTIDTFEKQIQQVRADFQRQIDAKDREIDRLQLAEQQWQQITLNSLGELDRSGRILERNVVMPLESQARQRLPGRREGSDR